MKDYRKIFICVLIGFLVFTGCDKECRSVTSVHEVYNEAFAYPELFDRYVLDNQAEFDSDYFSCLDEQIKRMDEIVEDAKQNCDDAHVQGSDFWHQCYDEIVDDQNVLAIFQTIKIVTAPDATLKFSETQAGFYLLFLKQSWGASEYESICIQARPLTKEAMTCTYCEKRFALF